MEDLICLLATVRTLNERKKKQWEPWRIRSRDMWISNPENNRCANKAIDVAVGEPLQVTNSISFVCLKRPYYIN